MRSAYYRADVSPRTSRRIGQWRGYAGRFVEVWSPETCPLPEKVEAIRTYSGPGTVKKLKQLLGVLHPTESTEDLYPRISRGANSERCEQLTKPVPRPFSIEALMSDCGPKRTTNVMPWTVSPPAVPRQFHGRDARDTDSDGSLDMDLAQDLSSRSQKDGTLLKVYSTGN
ncbi:hypothetical protein NQ318_018561 [Aromia moschata]|uniref:Uncharacterized protein n=1 Tax=Aromia moschata TaxID=1265417 RepID=A0AAV8ZHW9_9CUCU|nr:hypothetical protein NQ318_018561 [Aromia moschata]